VLIRGAEPVHGFDVMLNRTRKLHIDNTLTKGPGNVSKALGIHTTHTGLNLLGKKIFIIDDGYTSHQKIITSSPRIGVDYAEEDALLHYRFYIKGNAFVSGIIK
jgi:DNA-3-methyladenine glycosylase